MLNENILSIFGKRLKFLRESNNLTTRELGEIAGTSNATISRYETGKRDPNLLIVKRIADYFNVSIEYLCGEDTNDTTIISYSNLSEDNKKNANKYINYLLETEKKEK